MESFSISFKQVLFTLACFFSFVVFCKAQNADSVRLKLPAVNLKTLDGKTITSADIKNDGKPIVLVFWKSCCPPNIKMLDAINDVYSEWQKETGVVLYAISIDDSGTSNKIAPLVSGKSWGFNILLDINSDFKRAMNVNATPHVFILNGNNEVVWQNTTFLSGGEVEIYKIIRRFSCGKQEN